jgi:hypothetical protein
MSRLPAGIGPPGAWSPALLLAGLASSMFGLARLAIAGFAPGGNLAGELRHLIRQRQAVAPTADELRVEYASLLGWTGGLMGSGLTAAGPCVAPGRWPCPATAPDRTAAVGPRACRRREGRAHRRNEKSATGLRSTCGVTKDSGCPHRAGAA